MAPRPGLLLDAGPLIAWLDDGDRHAEDVAAWLRAQERAPAFGRWYVLDHVLDEVATFLHRTRGLRAQEAFLAMAEDPRNFAVVQVEPLAVVARLRRLPPARRTTDLTFTDAALAECGVQLGLRHVLSFDRALGGLGLEVVVPR